MALLILLIQVVGSDIVGEAVKFAASVADKPIQPRRTSEMKVKDAENAHQLSEGQIRSHPGVIP